MNSLFVPFPQTKPSRPYCIQHKRKKEKERKRETHAHTHSFERPRKYDELILYLTHIMYEKLLATKVVQLLMSHDQKAANIRLSEEKKKQRVKFKPAALVDSISYNNLSLSSKGVTGVAKTILKERDTDERH